MADSKKLKLASQYPVLSAQTGFGQEASSPIDQMLSNTGGSATSGARPIANAGAIGADNAGLASGINEAVQNIFALVRNASTNATNAAKEAALKRQQEEANAKTIAMQARVLEAQKKAALAALKGSPSGSSSSGTGNPTAMPMPTSIPLVPMPNLPTGKTPKVQPPKIAPNASGQIKFPKAKTPPKRDPRKPGIQN